MNSLTNIKVISNLDSRNEKESYGFDEYGKTGTNIVIQSG